MSFPNIPKVDKISQIMQWLSITNLPFGTLSLTVHNAEHCQNSVDLTQVNGANRISAINEEIQSLRFMNPFMAQPNDDYDNPYHFQPAYSRRPCLSGRQSGWHSLLVTGRYFGYPATVMEELGFGRSFSVWLLAVG
ncbi:MAG: hypothetical protein V2B20_14085 [Pseudomonadota bacterium]